MMQMLKKWTVIVKYTSQVPVQKFYISDNFYSNIFGTLSKMDFGPDVLSIEVLIELPESNSTVILQSTKKGIR